MIPCTMNNRQDIIIHIWITGNIIEHNFYFAIEKALRASRGLFLGRFRNEKINAVCMSIIP